MKAIVDKHIAACLVELRAQVEREFAEAIQGLTRAVEKPRRAVARQEHAARVKPATRAPKAPARSQRKPEAVSAKPAPVGAILGRPCGCGPVGRHRRECKLATGTGPRGAKKPASDDEDRGAARPVSAARDAGPDRDDPDLVAATQAVRASRAIEPAPELPVIPRSQLVSRLAADRERAGDAGGLALKQVGPSLVGVVPGAELERRETCPLHGWVGRRQFVEGGHAQCAQLPEGAEACRVCRGRRFAQSLPCKRCDGTGIESGDRGHHAKTETTNTPPRAAEGA